MNIFYLSKDTKQCAAWHNNKHVVKMILESAQLLSTAHRVLDGTPESVNGKIYNLLAGESKDNLICYRQTHTNHPSAIWVRAGVDNYNWLFNLFVDLMKEYTHRYGKHHVCEKYIEFLSNVPKNIGKSSFSEPPQCMPDEYKVANDTEKAYHNYYTGGKQQMAAWKNRNKPDWYVLTN